MSTQKIRKIGNSEGIIIPKAILESLGLTLGASVDLDIDQDKLILKPTKRYTLEELVSQMTPENEPPEISTGASIGDEDVEYDFDLPEDD